MPSSAVPGCLTTAAAAHASGDELNAAVANGAAVAAACGCLLLSFKLQRWTAAPLEQLQRQAAFPHRVDEDLLRVGHLGEVGPLS